MRSSKTWAGLLLLVLGAGVAPAQDEPQAPWVLSFSHGPLEVKNLAYRSGGSRAYYYFTFELENRSGVEASLAGLHVEAIVGTNPRKKETLYALPHPDVEEAVRRLSRADDLKNVIELRKMGTLAPGASVRGIAVLGTFNREWDKAVVQVHGLEPYAREGRVRKYGDAGFTIPHRAYYHHNRRVVEAADDPTRFTEVRAIVHHDVVWQMVFTREGDEFSPHLDPIRLQSEGWDVLETKIVTERPAPFGS